MNEQKQETNDIESVNAIIVDDHEVSRKFFGHVMALADIAVAGTATDGEEGLALFKELQPDIVLLDVRMPNMDGHEALAAIKKENRDAYVLMLSGNKDFHSISESMYAGAQDFISKDQHMDDIINRLKKHTSRYLSGEIATFSDRVTGHIRDV